MTKIDNTKPLELSDGVRRAGVTTPIVKEFSFQTDEQPDKVVVNGVSYVLTSEECLQSLERLARKIAASTGGDMLPGNWQREASEIVAELDLSREPVGTIEGELLAALRDPNSRIYRAVKAIR